jgi:hypothetical protein
MREKTWRDFVDMSKPDDKLAVYIDDAIADGWPQIGGSDPKWVVLHGELITRNNKFAERVVVEDIEAYYRRKNERLEKRHQ